MARLIEERGITTDELAKETNLSQNLIACLLTGEQILTADVAFVLGNFFEMSPLFWLDLQRRYYLEAQDVEGVDVLVTA